MDGSTWVQAIAAVIQGGAAVVVAVLTNRLVKATRSPRPHARRRGTPGPAARSRARSSRDRARPRAGRGCRPGRPREPMLLHVLHGDLPPPTVASAAKDPWWWAAPATARRSRAAPPPREASRGAAARP